MDRRTSVPATFRRVLVALGTSLLLITMGAFPSAPSALGAGSTCSNLGSYAAGYSSSYLDQNYGASAQIEYNNPDLCNTEAESPSASVAWAMTTARSASHPNNAAANMWAQVGYGQFGGKYSDADGRGIGTFAQWTKACKATLSCEVGVETRFNGVNPTGAWFYKAYWWTPDQHIHMTVNDQDFGWETNYNPFGVWDTAWACQFFGETIHPQSDVPGTSTDRTNFQWLRYYDSNADPHFTSLSGGPIISNSRYSTAIYSPSGGGVGVQVWTK